MLDELDQDQRRRIYRAVYRGEELGGALEARAAVEAAEKMRHQLVHSRLMRGWLAIGTLVLIVGSVIRLVGGPTWQDMVLPAAGVIALVAAGYVLYVHLPRRLDQAERKNRAVLGDDPDSTAV